MMRAGEECGSDDWYPKKVNNVDIKRKQASNKILIVVIMILMKRVYRFKKIAVMSI